MPTTSKRVTAAEVAELSGVSTATVSYVLNETPGQTISAVTRERVLASARTLGYIPNHSARTLASGSSRVVVIDLSEVPYGNRVAQLGRELGEAFEHRGYVSIVDQPERSTGRSRGRLLTLAALLSPEIVVTVTPVNEADREELRRLGVKRFTSVFGDIDAISAGTRSTARAQVGYLHEHGHLSLAFVGTNESHLSGINAVRRAAAFEEAGRRGLRCIDLGSTRDPDLLAGSLSAALRAENPPSGIVAYNDEIAMVAMSSANRIGRRVPEDLAVIGVDDSAVAALCVPPLTSVKMAGDEPPGIEQLLEAFDSGEEALIRSARGPHVVVRRSA